MIFKHNSIFFYIACQLKHCLSITYFVAAVLLSGCATLQPNPETSAHYWQSSDVFNELDTWVVRGKILIQHNGESFSSSLIWQEKNSGYRIQFSGPAGMGKLILTQANDTIRILTTKGSTTFSSVDEALRYYQLPDLPVKHLRYWIRGLASPLTNQQQSTEHSNTLKQANWTIVINDTQTYTHTDGQELTIPRSIMLNQAQSSATLFLYHWTF